MVRSMGLGAGRSVKKNAKRYTKPSLLTVGDTQAENKESKRRGRRVEAQFCYGGYVGCVTVIQTRQGPTVSIHYCPQAEMDVSDGKMWAVMCDDHIHIEKHVTKNEAVFYGRRPIEWCPDCKRKYARDKDSFGRHLSGTGEVW